MTTEKIYGPWIQWHGGECPVPPDTVVAVKLRRGSVMEPRHAGGFEWGHDGDRGDIVSYCTVTEQPDLGAAEKLLLDYGYTITPPAKPLTFEDVTPLTEVPPWGIEYWAVSATAEEGVYRWRQGNEYDLRLIKRRMAYLEKEHALIAARHHFGLKGGEL